MSSGDYYSQASAYDPTLIKLLDNGVTLHEQTPLGGLGGFSWFNHPDMEQGNTIPSNYTAMTGWGDAFYYGSGATGSLYIKNMQTFALSLTNGIYSWTKVQSGSISGFAYNPLTQAAQPSLFTGNNEGGYTATWASPYAFQWFPNSRFLLPANFVAVMVLFQARTDTGQLITGGGADYWQTLSSPSGNIGLAVGHLRVVTPQYQQFGFITAPHASLYGVTGLT